MGGSELTRGSALTERAVSRFGSVGRQATSLSTNFADAPLAVPVSHVTVEAAVPEWCDNESALAEGRIGPGVAVAA